MKRIICLAILGIGKGENHMKAMWKMRQKEPSKTVPLVVCVLIVSACFAILLIGCGHIPTDNGGDETSGGTGLPVEEFLFNRSISFYNGWLYSSLGAGGGLNKYKVDLLQEELVLPTGWSQALAINQDGRCIIKETIEKGRFSKGHPDYVPNVSEYYIYDVVNEMIGPAVLSENGESYRDAVLYKDKIILKTGEDADWQINIYDDQGNFEKSIFTGPEMDFGVIDDAIYFLPLVNWEAGLPEPKGSVMRYDMITGATDTVFDFDVKPANNYHIFQATINFNGRNLVVQNGDTSFVYTSIDNTEPKEIEFDFGEPRLDWMDFIPSDDENLYFMHGYFTEFRDGAWWGEKTEYAVVLGGTTDKTVLSGIDFDNGLYFAYGHIYYYDEESRMLKRDEYNGLS